MRALTWKLVRDVRRMRGQLIAVSLVVASGAALLVAMRNTYNSLLASRDGYYARYRFADVFAHLTRAPLSLATRIAAIPGVAAVQTRLVVNVTLDVPGLGEPATGRLISVPAYEPPRLNALHLRRGRWLASGAHDEVLANEAFVNANRLTLGDRIGAVINGRRRSLRIVGVVLSPEYIYALGGASVFPDDRRFGVFWMSDADLAPTFGMEGAFNDVALSLAPGASEGDVIERLDAVLAPYGGVGAYGRSEQLSNRFISDEISQNRVLSVVLPAIFLGVAIFLLHVVLSRVMRLQRDQIAILKAFGFSDRAVAAHYLGLALASILPGLIVGTAVGVALGWGLARFYTHFYHFPALRYEVHPLVIVAAAAVSVGAAVLGALGAVRQAVSLPPAQAMRPDSPARYRVGIAERLGLRKMFGPAGRMTIRIVERQPVRTAMSTLGVVLATAILVTGLSTDDAVQRIADIQFRLAQREDVTMVFDQSQSVRARWAIASLPGVMRVEAFRAVPVRMRSAHHWRRLTLFGLDSGTTLRRVVDRDEHAVAVPPAGVLLTTHLARILGVARGDMVTVELLEGTRHVRRLPVTGTVDELVGIGAYIDRQALDAIVGGAPVISGAYLTVDSLHAAELDQRLRTLPTVSAVVLRKATIASFEHTLSESMGVSIAFLVVFASVIAFGVVYNSSRVALSERERELASLRVLGFSRREVAMMLLGEQAIIIGVALPLGCLAGYGLDCALVRTFATELFRLPVVVSARSYATAMLV
ncbi:MAG TPA: ABC transporter permease, partial [Gemmatimonadaceae bacterium]